MATVIAVRLHNIARQLWFDPCDSGAQTGDHVIVTTERGTEMGLAVSDAFDVAESDLRAPLKPVLRVASEADLAKAEELGRRGTEALPVFREFAKRYELDMKPLDVDFLFGGDKAIFYFTAEERVDFRGLVRELASEFHTRIDMRQIGVRDEAQLVGGIAHCGQELCCVRMGGEFNPVSIRMAKEQDLPLNPLKISGFCGRLMCCLRYEFEAYKDFKSRAPKKNALIETPLGMAKVIGFGTPRETVDLRLEDGKTFTVPLAEMGYADGTVAGDYDDHAPASADKKDGKDAPASACASCASGSGKPPCPGRPCAVSRASLEEHGGTQIAMALAAYDREHGLIPEEDISDDLIDEVRERPKRRRSRGQKAAEKDVAAETAGEQPREGGRRRRHRRASEGEAAQAAEQTQTQQGSRRSRNKRAEAAESTEQAPSTRRNPRRRHRNAAKAEGEAAPQAQQPKQEGASEGQKRTPRQRSQRRGNQGEAAQTQAQKPKQERAQRPRPGQNSSGLRAQGNQGHSSGEQGASGTGSSRRRRRRRGGSQGGQGSSESQNQ